MGFTLKSMATLEPSTRDSTQWGVSAVQSTTSTGRYSSNHILTHPWFLRRPPGTINLLPSAAAADAQKFIDDNKRNTPQWSCASVMISGEFAPFTSKGRHRKQ